MTIYFYTTQPTISHKPNLKIIHALQKVGAMVYSNIEGLMSGFDIPHDIDGIVVLGEGKSREVAYIIALGIARNKPTLYVVPKGTVFPEEVAAIHKSKEIKKVLMLEYFSPITVENRIADFLSRTRIKAEEPSIKFTLRLTKNLQKYIAMKSKRCKLSKADYVRSLIDNAKKQDETHPLAPHAKRSEKLSDAAPSSDDWTG